MDEFWQQRLPQARAAVSGEKVLQLLVVNRLLDPGSEFHVHRQWFADSAMDELLQINFRVAEKDRLYRCLDRVLEHKQELFVWLKQKLAGLFQADFEVLLYDLTSTYFEGEMKQNPKARRGYSRDQRPDCLQLPSQPPPRIKASQVAPLATQPAATQLSLWLRRSGSRY